jgi:serine O-acetyltransferase
MSVLFSSRLVSSIRDYQRYAAQGGLRAAFMRRYARVRHVFWSVVTASDIDPRVKLGGNVRFPHPNGLVIHADAQIGDDCMIMQQVTLGITDSGGYPAIGNGVYIGAGAKILGKVRVGDGARVGAMAVVLSDVPAGCTAVGIPARIVGGRKRKA